MGDDPRQVGRKTRRAQSEAALSRIRAGFEPRRGCGFIIYMRLKKMVFPKLSGPQQGKI
jgi:hypothetical protein